MTLEIAPLTPKHFDVWGRLFEAANSTCFCQYWHFAADKNAWLARCAFEPDSNRQLSEQMLSEGNFPGLIALRGGVCVGWLKLSPAQQLVKIRNQSIYRTLQLESPDILIIGCLLVHPEHRKRGVARTLVKGAVVEAQRRGARAIEAYPYAVNHEVHDEQAFMGRVSMYEACGFVKTTGSEVYPVYQLRL